MIKKLQFKGIRKDNGASIIGGVSVFKGIVEMFDSNSVDNGCYEVIPGSVGGFVRSDEKRNPIFEGDKFKFRYRKELHKSIELIGSFCWNNDELRYEIDIWDHEEYVCLSYVDHGVMFDFELLP